MKFEVRRHTPEDPWTYPLLEARQAQLTQHVLTGGQGALLLSELAPVITTGRRTDPKDVIQQERPQQRPDPQPRPNLAPQIATQSPLHPTLSNNHTHPTHPVHPVERGGLATYHGPGQWVLFAVDRLQILTGDSRGVRLMVQALLDIALEVGRKYEPRAEIREGAQLGVWTPRGKFAAVGIKIKLGVVQHGLSINGFRTPESFVGLRPCGLDLPVDYLLPPAPSLGGLNAQDPRPDFDELGHEIIAVAQARLTKFRAPGYS